jgi:hypothetical protein
VASCALTGSQAQSWHTSADVLQPDAQPPVTCRQRSSRTSPPALRMRCHFDHPGACGPACAHWPSCGCRWRPVGTRPGRTSSMCLRCHRSPPVCARRVTSACENRGAGGSSGRVDRRQGCAP